MGGGENVCIKSLPKFITAFLCILVVGTAVAVPPSQAFALPGDAVDLYKQGQNALAENNFYLAVEKYKAALAVNPNYLDAYKGLAESFYFLGEYDEALRNIEAAKRLSRNDIMLLNFEGRIWVVKGSLDKAKALFQQVLSKEPNNIEAMTGIALLDVAAGRTRYAASQCEEALRLNPTHRVTLLTLAILNESMGDTATAEKYVELALKYHANSALVHFTAGRFYYDVNNQYKAESHLKTALGLDGEFEDARILLGNLYILMKSYSRAIEVLRPLLNVRADNAFAYYSLGMAYWYSGDATQALQSLERAQRLKPDDEIIKLTLEQLSEAELPMLDERRITYAKQRFSQGQLFEGKNLYTTALLEYRRAVMLNPMYKDAHFALAGIYRKRGFPMKYLSTLVAITEKNIVDRRIQDDIEYYRTKTYGTVAEKWQLDQHNIVIKSLAVSMFYLPGRNSSLHPTSDGIVAAYFKDVLDGFDKMDVGKTEPVAANYEQAFRTARSDKSDYFLIFSFTESERSFRATCMLYLSRTGTELARFSAERTGNDRIRDTLLRVGNSLSDTLPLRGVLLKKQFDNGVIDIGRIHGLEEKKVLLIVKQGRVGLQTDKVGFTYQPGDVVGELTLTKVDEAVAEGAIAKKSFYDYAAAGDEVLYLPQGIPKLDESAGSPGSLLESLMILK
ncbi:MAG: hypothetical protein EHM28_09390 [Spirochaetaceae bacterium]|nr:MAG: hypothetical protein EHM28_09390 [Spirochaetaceae bacterium]